MQLIVTAAPLTPFLQPSASVDSKQTKADKGKNKTFVLLPSDTWGHFGSPELGRGKISCWILGGTVGNNVAFVRHVTVNIKMKEKPGHVEQIQVRLPKFMKERIRNDF